MFIHLSYVDNGNTYIQILIYSKKNSRRQYQINIFSSLYRLVALPYSFSFQIICGVCKKNKKKQCYCEVEI